MRAHTICEHILHCTFASNIYRLNKRFLGDKTLINIIFLYSRILGKEISLNQNKISKVSDIGLLKYRNKKIRVCAKTQFFFLKRKKINSFVFLVREKYVPRAPHIQQFKLNLFKKNFLTSLNSCKTLWFTRR